MSSYYAQKIKAYSERTMHEKPAERLRSLGVNLAKFMAFAVPSVEYQHHRLRWPAWCGRTPL
ncbi:Reverse transcriptase/endonuclease [Giardia duodenalis]|uniref:Reverse transcriptase/endonuclease n=1 Tax=Giardia intestinalis TaxID=5741 RepID=V6TLY8_GIAIN|nr:Reverse transcriptase/endonuclease [Giardia intestinalis]